MICKQNILLSLLSHKWKLNGEKAKQWGRKAGSFMGTYKVAN